MMKGKRFVRLAMMGLVLLAAVILVGTSMAQVRKKAERPVQERFYTLIVATN